MERRGWAADVVVLYPDGRQERFWGARMKVPRGCKEVLEKEDIKWLPPLAGREDAGEAELLLPSAGGKGAAAPRGRGR